MTPLRLAFGAATDAGPVRETNEDAHVAAPPLFAVADGMGGHDAGDVASRIAVEELARLAGDDRAHRAGGGGLDAEAGTALLDGAFATVRRRIAELEAGRRAAGDGEFTAGTTASVALGLAGRGGPRWLVANVGDSRTYRLHRGGLDQVTVDHSLVQELVDAGSISPEEAAAHPARHVITRALGAGSEGAADYFLLPMVGGERLLLCSDGVSGPLGAAGIEELLRAGGGPRAAADALVQAALAAGGRDNATALVVDVVGLAHDMSHDSVAERGSPEEKLGALP
ncbi:protein phosphatase 2C domain-containing protein [Nocardioides sp. YIM 152588]|uniref:PP2C family protein-serine/threonine phosphatase n=1 Tax=Nocardioides sp. YIM 152588 TaxID=3158259 RepID=UPI0032E41979